MAIVFPTQNEENKPPAMAWLMQNSSSINGMIGDMIDLAEKTKYQWPQNKISRNSFICR